LGVVSVGRPDRHVVESVPAANSAAQCWDGEVEIAILEVVDDIGGGNDHRVRNALAGRRAANPAVAISLCVAMNADRARLRGGAHAAAVLIALVLIQNLITAGRFLTLLVGADFARAIAGLFATHSIGTRSARLAATIGAGLVRFLRAAQAVIGTRHVLAVLTRTIRIDFAGVASVAGRAWATTVDSRLLLILEPVRAARLRTVAVLAELAFTIPVRLAYGALRARVALGAATIDVRFARVLLAIRAGIDGCDGGTTVAGVVTRAALIPTPATATGAGRAGAIAGILGRKRIEVRRAGSRQIERESAGND